ncbi:hypothetical protein [Lutimonas vermicola]|uniref:Uncharacterized protein n=1 Tax=Lutimonas vermicola TaxID=414288 RepID=A0ABU9L4P5_9FLAO
MNCGPGKFTRDSLKKKESWKRDSFFISYNVEADIIVTVNKGKLPIQTDHKFTYPDTDRISTSALCH